MEFRAGNRKTGEDFGGNDDLVLLKRAFPASYDLSALHDERKEYPVHGEEFSVVFDVGHGRSVLVSEKVFVESRKQSDILWFLNETSVFREKICFSIFLQRFKFVVNERNGGLAFGFPKAAPPGEIVGGRRRMASEIGSRKFGKLFVARKLRSFRNPFFQKDERFFFFRRSAETDESPGSGVACEMVRPLRSHGNSRRFEHFGQLRTREGFSSSQSQFHGLERFFGMRVRNSEELAPFREAGKRLRRAERKQPPDVFRIDVVQGSAHRPRTNDGTARAGVADGRFGRPGNPGADRPSGLRNILRLHATVVRHRFFRRFETRFRNGMRRKAERKEFGQNLES